MYVYAMCVQVPEKARRGHQIPGTGVSGGSELPDIGTGNWRSSKCFQSPSRISSPQGDILLQNDHYQAYKTLFIP